MRVIVSAAFVCRRVFGVYVCKLLLPGLLLHECVLHECLLHERVCRTSAYCRHIFLGLQITTLLAICGLTKSPFTLASHPALTHVYGLLAASGSQPATNCQLSATSYSEPAAHNQQFTASSSQAAIHS